MEFTSQPKRVLPLILLADTSSSMNSCIGELNTAIRDMLGTLKEQESLKAEIYISFITFGKGGANLHTALTPVSDIEFKSEEKSYSFLTALKLYEQYKIDGKIHFIIGTDAFEKIESWYESDKFKKIVDFIVFVRENDTVNLEYLKKKGYNFEFTQMPFVDISSTELRNRVLQGLPINNIVTKEVEEYIYKNGLYKNT